MCFLQVSVTSMSLEFLWCCTVRGDYGGRWLFGSSAGTELGLGEDGFYNKFGCLSHCTTKNALMEIYKGDSNCVLCRQSLECRVHLFFERSFSRRIWSQLMCWCLITTPIFHWVHIIEWGKN